MGHKTKDMRRQEAMERKRKFLPVNEARVAEALAYALQHPNEAYAQERLRSEASALEAAYVDAGYSLDMAVGMANAAAAGKPGSWLSNMSNLASATEATTLEEAVDRVKSMTPAVSSAHLMPHPFRPAIQITLEFQSQSEKHMVADMSILEIDRLIAALTRAGVPAMRVRC